MENYPFIISWICFAKILLKFLHLFPCGTLVCRFLFCIIFVWSWNAGLLELDEKYYLSIRTHKRDRTNRRERKKKGCVEAKREREKRRDLLGELAQMIMAARSPTAGHPQDPRMLVVYLSPCLSLKLGKVMDNSVWHWSPEKLGDHQYEFCHRKSGDCSSEVLRAREDNCVPVPREKKKTFFSLHFF